MKEFGKYNIDHIYSIMDGFRNKVNPKIIGSFVNLQVLPSIDNIRKRDESWITLEELKKEYKENACNILSSFDRLWK